MTDAPRGGKLAAPAVLLAAIAACALILWVGPQLAGRLISVLSGDAAASEPVVETIATVVIFGLLLAAGLGGGALCRLNAARPGPQASFRLLEGAGIGLAGFLIATALAGIAGVLHWAQGGTGAAMLLGGTALVAVQAASEEVFFRGWLQPVLVKAWGVAGIAIAALTFAALHLMNGVDSLVSVANVFLGGLLFGLLAARYGGIAAAVGAHFVWNWAEQLLFGLYPNPGAGSFGSILNLELVGSDWWGGSNQGLNASMAMTFALAILLAPLLIVPARDSPRPELYRSGRAPV